jgi:hypothetical protein
MNPEMLPDSLIKDEWQDILHERYKERLMADICPNVNMSHLIEQ